MIIDDAILAGHDIYRSCCIELDQTGFRLFCSVFPLLVMSNQGFSKHNLYVTTGERMLRRLTSLRGLRFHAVS